MLYVLSEDIKKAIEYVEEALKNFFQQWEEEIMNLIEEFEKPGADGMVIYLIEKVNDIYSQVFNIDA